ncbi:hypothetical protein ABIB94_006990 [Bradyrhizobium sp. JR7.2]|jgi:hypothetical protein
MVTLRYGPKLSVWDVALAGILSLLDQIAQGIERLRKAGVV